MTTVPDARPRRVSHAEVWSVGDFGVRQGHGPAWRVPTPTGRELEPLGDRYRPYRTAVAWYCWRAVELYAGVTMSSLTR
jgi:DNA-3-methyladenine glycosylase II